MESNIEIILMGSIDRLLEIFENGGDDNCINIYHSIDGLMIVSHSYKELMYFMKKNFTEFKNREYVLKELNEEEENRYLTLFNITDLETIKNIIYEELKHLPATKYPREE